MRLVHIPDLREDEAYMVGEPIRVASVDRLGMRSWLGVPLLKEDEDLTGQSGLGSHGALKSARLRRKSEATSSTLRPCKSTAALRAAIVSLLSWPDSFSKGALICGNRSKVVLRTTGASM